MEWSFNELELEQIAQWPSVAKGILFTLLFTVLCLVGGYFFVIEPWALLRQTQQKSIVLTPILMQKKAMADSLPIYQQQAEQVVQQEKQLLQQVPTQRDTAKLLQDISTLAQRYNLKITSLQWEKEQATSQLNSPDNIHSGLSSTKLSLRMSFQGQYHQLGLFVAALSALSRIVLIDSLTLTRLSTLEDDMASLNMELLASTYTSPELEAEDSP